MKIPNFNITDGASVGGSFVYLQAQADNLIGADVKAQIITLGLSLIIGLIAKIASKLIASIFTRKKVTKEDVINDIRETLIKEFEKQNVPMTPEEIEEKVQEAAEKILKKFGNKIK